MSDTVQEKHTEDGPMPDPRKEGQIKSEDVAQATETIKRAQATRGTDGDIVEFSDILTTFVYVLLRDYLPAGQVECAVKAVLDGETVLFTDSFLAQYADNLANTLKEAKIGALANALEKVFTEKDPLIQSLDGLMPKTTKKPVASFGDDDEALKDLQQKVEEAIGNMNEEDETAWEERKQNALDELSRNDEVGLKTVYADSKPSDVEVEAKKRLKDAAWRNKPQEAAATEDGLSEEDTRNSAAGLKTTHIESAKASIERQKEDVESSQYPEQIAKSLDALSNLKELLPTDTIKQVADILRQEVESELVGEEDKVLTREDILQKKAEIAEEHKAANPEAAKMAEQYIKEQLESTADKALDEIEEDTAVTSRGKLKDVRQGKAFPEALEKVFDDDDSTAKLKKAEAIKKQMEDLREAVSGDRPHPGIFQRVE